MNNAYKVNLKFQDNKSGSLGSSLTQQHWQKPEKNRCPKSGLPQFWVAPILEVTPILGCPKKWHQF